MDKTTFQQGMAYLAAAYDIQLTPERAAVYWDQLGGLRDEPFLVACKVAVGTHRRFPTVPDLRDLYRDELRRMTLSSVPRLPSPDQRSRDRALSMIRGLRERMR